MLTLQSNNDDIVQNVNAINVFLTYGFLPREMREDISADAEKASDLVTAV